MKSRPTLLDEKYYPQFSSKKELAIAPNSPAPPPLNGAVNSQAIRRIIQTGPLVAGQSISFYTVGRIKKDPSWGELASNESGNVE